MLELLFTVRSPFGEQWPKHIKYPIQNCEKNHNNYIKDFYLARVCRFFSILSLQRFYLEISKSKIKYYTSNNFSFLE